MLEKLIKMADNLDRLGMEKEAGAIDLLIEKYAQATASGAAPLSQAQVDIRPVKKSVNSALGHFVSAQKELQKALDMLNNTPGYSKSNSTYADFCDRILNGGPFKIKDLITNLNNLNYQTPVPNNKSSTQVK